jgi:very-short-patch-repair endonuclease
MTQGKYIHKSNQGFQKGNILAKLRKTRPGFKFGENNPNFNGKVNKGRKRPDVSIRMKIDNPMKNIKYLEKNKKSKIGHIYIRKKSFNKNKGRKISSEKYPNWGFRSSRSKIVLPVKDTSIEVKIQSFLKELNIKFVTHKYININHGYQCDIFIPSLNLVIECDGDYWHKYPNGREIDKTRTQELIQKGYKVLRLWGSDIDKMTIKDLQKVIDGGFTNSF